MTELSARLPLDLIHERGDALAAQYDAETLLAAADDVRGFNVMLMEHPRVRRTLSNPGVPEDLKRQLVGDLFAEHMGAAGLGMCERLVSNRWRSPAELLDGAEIASAWMYLLVADKRGEIEQVEEELFRFWRILLASPDLVQVMEDERVPVQRRSDLLRSLLADKANSITLRLLNMSIARPGGVPFLLSVERAIDLAAEVKTRRVAYVTAAAPLTDQEMASLAAELGRESGAEIDVKVSVDPSILGGVIIRLGDELIDGSVRRRLKDAQRELGTST
jgi:F-type H+-transporting ATPase subunit delta